MTKAIVFLSFSILGFLVLISSFYPTASAIWLASTAEYYNYGRLMVMAILLFLLVTTPPRNILVRWSMGYTATVLAAWSIFNTYENNILLLDGFAYLAAAISIGIATLEYFPERSIDWFKYLRKIHIPASSVSHRDPRKVVAPNNQRKRRLVTDIYIVRTPVGAAWSKLQHHT